MKLVVLDGYTENPGDLRWDALEAFGELTVYDRTAYAESPLIAERLADCEIAITNKTPISRATTSAITTRPSMPDAGSRAPTGAIGTIP